MVFSLGSLPCPIVHLSIYGDIVPDEVGVITRFNIQHVQSYHGRL